ncbi:MAG TPA: hypothetical protein VGG27_15645 [Magnetospirillaceae bacterium]|jgi:hypothetical protein
MTRKIHLYLSLFMLGVAGTAWADENSDLDSIPGTIGQQPPTAPNPPATTSSSGALSTKTYVEDAFTQDVLRSHLAVPLPSSSSPSLDWQNRTSLDEVATWHAAEGLDATVSDRFNLFEQNNYAFPVHQDIQNDFREGYVTWQGAPETYLEAGRINIRHGVAVGFNPTDFFKTRTLVDQASQDPSVLRNDRLGTGMVQAQKIFEGGSIALDIAPKLRSVQAIPVSTPAPSFDPGFGRTNSENRMLLSGSYDIGGGMTPELLAYHADSGTKFGANISRTIGQSVVAYAEWAGGNEASLTSRAIEFGKLTGTLPAAVPDSDSGTHFQNDAAIGASWTSAVDKLTLNLEYHYHQSAFSGSDWHNWFTEGNSHTPNINGVLWYIRSYAQDQQEPMSQQEVFLRADWTDAFIDKLELSAIAFVNVYDGSMLTQGTASYYVSDAWTLSALVGGTIGGAHTQQGSTPQEASFIAEATRYF